MHSIIPQNLIKITHPNHLETVVELNQQFIAQVVFRALPYDRQKAQELENYKLQLAEELIQAKNIGNANLVIDKINSLFRQAHNHFTEWGCLPIEIKAKIFDYSITSQQEALSLRLVHQEFNELSMRHISVEQLPVTLNFLNSLQEELSLKQCLYQKLSEFTEILRQFPQLKDLTPQDCQYLEEQISKLLHNYPSFIDPLLEAFNLVSLKRIISDMVDFSSTYTFPLESRLDFINLHPQFVTMHALIHESLNYLREGLQLIENAHHKIADRVNQRETVFLFKVSEELYTEIYKAYLITCFTFSHSPRDLLSPTRPYQGLLPSFFKQFAKSYSVLTSLYLRGSPHAPKLPSFPDIDDQSLASHDFFNSKQEKYSRYFFDVYQQNQPYSLKKAQWLLLLELAPLYFLVPKEAIANQPFHQLENQLITPALTFFPLAPKLNPYLEFLKEVRNQLVQSSDPDLNLFLASLVSEKDPLFRALSIFELSKSLWAAALVELNNPHKLVKFLSYQTEPAKIIFPIFKQLILQNKLPTLQFLLETFKDWPLFQSQEALLLRDLLIDSSLMTLKRLNVNLQNSPFLDILILIYLKTHSFKENLRILQTFNNSFFQNGNHLMDCLVQQTDGNLEQLYQIAQSLSYLSTKFLFQAIAKHAGNPINAAWIDKIDQLYCRMLYSYSSKKIKPIEPQTFINFRLAVGCLNPNSRELNKVYQQIEQILEGPNQHLVLIEGFLNPARLTWQPIKIIKGNFNDRFYFLYKGNFIQQLEYLFGQKKNLFKKHPSFYPFLASHALPLQTIPLLEFVKIWTTLEQFHPEKNYPNFFAELLMSYIHQQLEVIYHSNPQSYLENTHHFLNYLENCLGMQQKALKSIFTEVKVYSDPQLFLDKYSEIGSQGSPLILRSVAWNYLKYFISIPDFLRLLPSGDSSLNDVIHHPHFKAVLVQANFEVLKGIGEHCTALNQEQAQVFVELLLKRNYDNKIAAGYFLRMIEKCLQSFIIEISLESVQKIFKISRNILTPPPFVIPPTLSQTQLFNEIRTSLNHLAHDLGRKINSSTNNRLAKSSLDFSELQELLTAIYTKCYFENESIKNKSYLDIIQSLEAKPVTQFSPEQKAIIDSLLAKIRRLVNPPLKRKATEPLDEEQQAKNKRFS